MDDLDRLNCSDVVCARSGHYACHDMPPPRGDGTTLLCCWDCKTPLAEADARRVPINPGVPKWMTSTTVVCPACYDNRPDSVEVSEA